MHMASAVWKTVTKCVWGKKSHVNKAISVAKVSASDVPAWRGKWCRWITILFCATVFVVLCSCFVLFIQHSRLKQWSSPWHNGLMEAVMLLLVTEPKPSHMNASPPALEVPTFPTFSFLKSAVISFPFLLCAILPQLSPHVGLTFATFSPAVWFRTPHLTMLPGGSAVRGWHVCSFFFLAWCRNELSRVWSPPVLWCLKSEGEGKQLKGKKIRLVTKHPAFDFHAKIFTWRSFQLRFCVYHFGLRHKHQLPSFFCSNDISQFKRLMEHSKKWMSE